MKRFNFVAPIHFETWDYRNPDEKGIGGSETAVVEMSRRLAARGHPVTVYAPIPGGYARRHEGVLWKSLKAVDPDEEAIWVLSRCPWDVDRGYNGEVWIVMQDLDALWLHGNPWSEERVEKMTWIMALSDQHARHLAKNGDHVAEKLAVSSNGARIELLEEIEANGAPDREHFTGIYGSSPDRGLVQALLPFWSRVREFCPDAELNVFYGWDNINRWIESGAGPGAQKHKDAFERFKDQPGINWAGRIGQRQLYQEWLRAGVWPYWTDFFETSCIASMEAQAAGAIPITRAIGALADNVKFGILEDGWAWKDSRTICSLVAHTAKFMQWSAEGRFDKYRAQMMEWARWAFDWEHIVDQYLCIANGWSVAAGMQTSHVIPFERCVFQREHVRGAILNIGSSHDPSMLRAEAGAFNIDVEEVNENTGVKNDIDEIGDARDLRFGDNSFDSVVIGDLLEHVDEGEALQIVNEAKRVARDRVVVTVPEDRRSQEQIEEDNRGMLIVSDRQEYTGGASVHHVTPWTKEMFVRLFGEPMIYRRYRTPFCIGHGFVLDARR